MKRFLVIALASLGGLVLLSFLVLLLAGRALLAPASIPDRVILTLDLERGLVETAPRDPLLLALERRRLKVREAVDALHRGAEDDRVVGLWVKGGDSPGGWGRAQELRDAVEVFRASGKPTVLFAETFGEFLPAHGAYHLATAFEHVILQPSGEVAVAGLAAEAPFFEGALDKLDIEARFDARGEYKDAGDIFTRDGFSDSSREALEALLGSLLSTFRDGVTQGRGLPADSVRSLLDRGPFHAEEALALGLVDELGYRDEAMSRMEARVGGGTTELSVRDYHARGGRAWDRGARIAVIYGLGAIQRGSSGFDPLSGEGAMGASDVAAAFREAVEDDRVRAILFRVDSPGGSWVASDVIRREILRAREEGKPVVVSMGNAAASGGYLISSAADRIVAHPTTITGSIGVVAGRFVLEDFFQRLGITWDRVEVGESAGYLGGMEDFTDEEWERFQASLDRIYEGFVGRVAEDRGMEVDRVEAVARGRIWSGRDAMELGLVDELGGFGTAVAVARELAGLEVDARVQLRVYPAEPTLFQLLMEEGWGVEASGGLVSGLLRGAARSLGLPGSTAPAQPVRLPFFQVEGG